MKQSHIMSRIRRTAPASFLPKLPIEVWFETWPFHTWSVVEDEDDYIFQFRWKSKSEGEGEVKFVRGTLCKAFGGTEYLDGLLAIDAPHKLVKFMNSYACPIDAIVQDPVDGEWHRTTAPFRWSTFIEAQARLKGAMRIPIPKLLRHAELKSFFDLKTLTVMAERRHGTYYGIVTMNPSFDGCYRVIAFERLLANVQYGFCERCDKPFRVTSKHKRKYCETATCGHAIAQQRYREKEK